MKRVIGAVGKSIYFKITLAVLLVLLVAASAYFIYLDMERQSKIREFEGLVLPNIFINDYNLEGKKLADLETILAEKASVFKEEKIVFAIGEERFERTFSDLGVNINYQDILVEINTFLAGLENEEKLALIENTKEKKFSFIVTFDEEKKVALLRLLEEEINVVMQEPALVRAGGTLRFSEGQDGRVFDFDANKELLNEKIGTGEEIELKVAEVPRTRDGTLLSSVNTRLSAFTTHFNNSGGRAFNIRLATSRIDGTILMPGEVFSFARVAGAPYLRAQGYQQATVFYAGRITTNYGGGICQVSTTLYGAQLRAGLTTVQRSAHGMPVSYVPRGLDAMVAFTSVDYRFRNNYRYPIFISAFTNGGALTMEIWSSNRAAPGRRFEPHVENVGENVYRTYLREFHNNRLVNTRFLHVSRYRDLPAGDP